jgi:hypothetical protein
MAEFDWITVEYLQSIIAEAESHPSRVNYVNQTARGNRYYSAAEEWWVPIDGTDDYAVADDEFPSRENVIYDTVNEVNSLFWKNDPMIRHHPVGHPELADLATEMDKILLTAWRNAQTRHVMRTMHKEACMGGLSVGKVGWSKANKMGNPDGDVMIVKREPAMVLLDPWATNSHRALDCRYIVDHTRQVPEAVLYRYGVEGAHALGLRGPGGRKPKSFSALLNSVKDKLSGLVKGESREAGEVVDRRVDVYEFWLFPIAGVGRGSDLVVGELLDEKAYPYGIVATMINDEIVRIIKNPFVKKRRLREGEGLAAESVTAEVGHKVHPFVLMYWDRGLDEDNRDGIYDCTGMVQQQIALQIDVNRLSTSVLRNASSISNPGFTYIADAIDMPEGRITFPPGGGLPINPKYSRGIDDVIRFRDGKQLPAYVYELMRDKKQAVRMMGGVKPGMIGLEPRGTSHTPMGTIGGIQEASFSRMWAPSDELGAALAGVAYRYLGLIQQYYKPGRYVELSLEGQETYAQIQGAHLATQFRVEVVSGTTTPVHDVGKYETLPVLKREVDQALATQHPDIIESTLILLRNLDNPYSFQWIKQLERKLEQLKQQQMELQQIGAMGLQQGLQGQQGQLGGAQGAGMDDSGVRALADEMGVPAERIMQALGQ